ncbi:hypothetical protein GIS00_13665 [Nakamurella sp. YIM 132087]|uniref:Uncharacterized protein n=1 Tax=Nakamurella alba TaxID=2665158 RepID=A0A7K1FLG3_9ACTN|nr:hypothetical protein [Nakamurella alba]
MTTIATHLAVPLTTEIRSRSMLMHHSIQSGAASVRHKVDARGNVGP